MNTPIHSCAYAAFPAYPYSGLRFYSYTDLEARMNVARRSSYSNRDFISMSLRSSETWVSLAGSSLATVYVNTFTVASG